MPPPPPPKSNRAGRVPGRGGIFKPARSLHPPNPQNNALSSTDQNQPMPRDRRPPPTPQAHTQAPNRSAFAPLATQTQSLPQTSHPRTQSAAFTPVADLHPAKSLARFTSSSSNNRFIPTSNINPNPVNQRFVPPTPTDGSQRFVPPGSRAPSRATNSSHTMSGQGGQRMPFVPGAQSRFG
jgi:hypothetical protein